MNSKQDDSTQTSHLVGNRALARSAVWNFFGQAAPLLIALVAVPVLVKGLGTNRFGILTLALAIIGYAGVFDLGLGRALTKVVADRLGQRATDDLPETISTALVLMFGFGCMGAIGFAAASPWLARDVLKIPGDIAGETLRSLLILAASLPVVICSTGLRGVLEAFQRFDLVGRVRLFAGVMTFVGPLLVLPVSHGLDAAVAVLALGRIGAAVLNLWYCISVVPGLRARLRFGWANMGPLARFAGWLTVSNVVSPLLFYVDRFVIGAMISAAALAYYSTPLEMVIRLWVIPNALTGVLFPAFATTVQESPHRLELLFGRGLKYAFLVMFPLTVVLIAFGREALSLWLGPEFAAHSTAVLQWLAAGVFLSSLTQIAFALVQGCGRADITAKIPLVELPIFIPAIWWLTREFGIEGTAAAWTVRAAIDCAILFVIGARLIRMDGARVLGAVAAAGLALAAFAAAALPFGPLEKSAGCIVALSMFAIGTWVFALTPGERNLILGALGRKA